MSSTTSTRPERVPVEHRFLGLDKRSFPYAFFVIAVFLVATVLIPRINDAVDWDDPVLAGEQLALSDTIAFTPTTGWNVESGHRVGEVLPAGTPDDATVVGDGVTFSIQPGAFDGTPAELLRQVEKVTSSTGDASFRVDGDPATVTTPAGDVGVIQTYSSVNGGGLIATFVIDGTGLKVTAYGPSAQLRAAADDVDQMIASIQATDGSAS